MNILLFAVEIIVKDFFEIFPLNQVHFMTIENDSSSPSPFVFTYNSTQLHHNMSSYKRSSLLFFNITLWRIGKLGVTFS